MMTAIALLAVMGVGEPDGLVRTAPETGVSAAVMDAAAAPVAAPQEPAAPHGLTTEQQIDRWIAGRAAPEGVDAATAPPERRISGYVEAGIGSGGSSSYGGGVAVPLGERGFAEFHYRRSEGRARYRPYDDWGGSPFGERRLQD